ncbi:hypothetical protein FRC02_004569, partial [Tulasnella sp. 418]
MEFTLFDGTLKVNLPISRVPTALAVGNAETVCPAQEPSHVSTWNEVEVAQPLPGTSSVAPAHGGYVSSAIDVQVPNTKTVMSPEDARLYNLDPFLFHYRKELHTRLQCDQYITKTQWDWYNSPTSIPLPTTLELTSESSSLDSSPLGPPSPASVVVQSASDIRLKVPIADAIPMDTSGPCALASPSGALILGNSTADVAAANSDIIPTHLQSSTISN